jgi:hypothetical protein
MSSQVSKVLFLSFTCLVNSISLLSHR